MNGDGPRPVAGAVCRQLPVVVDAAGEFPQPQGDDTGVPQEVAGREGERADEECEFSHTDHSEQAKQRRD